MVKSGPELLQIRRAARIVRNAFDFIAAASLKEPNEKFLEAAVRREARLEGAEDFRMMIARPGEKSWSFRPPETRTILSDDRVMISLSVEFERYWAAAVRTYSFQGAAFTEVLPDDVRALSAGITAELQSGRTAAQFHQAALAKIAESGRKHLADYGLGEGIGLSPAEYPALARDDHSTLREGMTLSFRLGLYDPELRAIINGETIYLSRKGCEILTR
jgi:Xaa-Pro dipeptidase